VLDRLDWARDVVVVDSYSTDETLEILARFPKVRIFQRTFDSFSKQCNFGLKETQIQTEWVLSLDADYLLTQELVDELHELIPSPNVNGFRAHFIYCINGRRLRSGIYPPVTVLFRRDDSAYDDDGHAHRIKVKGAVQDLKSKILHDDRKSLSRWFQSQQRYTALEANKLLNAKVDSLSRTDRVRQLRVVAPLAMAFYCLIVRGGILDGRAGFFYAFQRMLAELMLSLYLIDDDLSRAFSAPTLPQAGNEGLELKEKQRVNRTFHESN